MNNHSKSLIELKEKFELQKQATRSPRSIDLSNQNYLNVRETVFQYSKNLEIKEIQFNTLKLEFDKTKNDSSEHNDSLQEFEKRLTRSYQKKNKNNLYSISYLKSKKT